MNNPQVQEHRLDILSQSIRPWGTWLVGPGPLVLTWEQVMGSPEDEIARQGIQARPDTYALPEVDPDEFERIFNWFQS